MRRAYYLSQRATETTGKSIFEIKKGSILSLILHLYKGQHYVSILSHRRICATCWRVVRRANTDHRTHICGSTVQLLEEVLKQYIVIRRITKQERIRQNL